jgi:hypothetical protein
MSDIKCCLEKSCKVEHTKATSPKYTAKLFQIGKLFDGKPVCAWCALHLQDMTRIPMNENDLRLEDLKVKFPGYWRVVETEGIDKVRQELNRTWLEIEPDTPAKAEPTVIKYVGHKDKNWK